MGWVGEFCRCGEPLPKGRSVHYRIAGVEVCARCWARPRIAPSLATWPYKEDVLIGNES
jgi:hypothetical protein